MKVYDEVAKVVEPKQQALMEATETLQEEQEKLAAVQEELAAVIAKVEALQAACDQTVAEKQRLQDAADTTENRLARAGKLRRPRRRVGAMGGDGREPPPGINLTGDVFISSAFIAYCGPFTAGYRKSCREVGGAVRRARDPASDSSRRQGDGRPGGHREWQIWGLPDDDYSTENGILARGQALAARDRPAGAGELWMRNMEASNGVKVARATTRPSCVRSRTRSGSARP